MTEKPTVLYAYIHNSGRSVAAQVLPRHYGGDAVEVRSAGSEPGAGINPVVAKVLAERGLPVGDHTSTKLGADLIAFELDVLSDRATYQGPARASVGMRHVIVGGVPVMRDGGPTSQTPCLAGW